MTIQVEIISDIACPWCYVGKHALDNAVEKFGKPVKIIYQPYMIDKRTKNDGEEYLAYNARRWGGDGWTHALRQRGKKVNCEFKHWKIWPHTLLAHCLLEYVLETSGWEAQIKMKEGILQGCYEQGMNVSLIQDLAKIASNSCGLDEKKTSEILKSKHYEKEVLRKDDRAKSSGVNGVPYFKFSNGQGKVKSLSGCPSVEHVLTTLESLQY